MTPPLDDKYLKFAEMTAGLLAIESQLRNTRRVIDELRADLTGSESDGSYGIDLAVQAFKNLTDQLEVLALENAIIHNNLFKDDISKCLLLPSNLKAFIITLLADAKKNGKYSKNKSKDSPDGVEFTYTINITKWSGVKDLQLVCIVENNNIKAGYFNYE